MKLENERCVSNAKEMKKLSWTEIQSLMEQLEQWETNSKGHLSKNFLFPDFASGLTFVNKIGEVAEIENHHPDVFLTWGKVEISLWTHFLGGITRNDFILAAKIEKIYHELHQ